MNNLFSDVTIDLRARTRFSTNSMIFHYNVTN